MARGSIHLIGGGWNEAGYPHTYGRFARAVAAAGGGTIACVLLAGPDQDAYYGRSRDAFASIGVADLAPVFVSASRPLHRTDVHGAGGILVGGGLTPAYHDAILPAAGDWLPGLIDNGLPYAGFSAGAMIAPVQGIVGGWKLRRDGRDLTICPEDVSEDEDELDIRPGLGLAPFAVDVHAAQYGTPTRLFHAVDAGLVPEGWAVDEDTALEIAPDGSVSLHGLGCGWHARRQDGTLRIDIVQPDL